MGALLTPLLTATALLSSMGCGSSKASCVWELPKTDEAYKRCEDRKESQQDYERSEKADRAKRSAEYEAAVGPCDRGEPEACATVAMYGLAHGHARAPVDRALAVACGGKLADPCFTLGARTTDAAAKQQWLQRACALDHARACTDAAALALDPAARVDLEVRACELGVAEACERAGLTYLEARGIPADRARGETLLKRACRADRKEACRRLGQLAVEP